MTDKIQILRPADDEMTDRSRGYVLKAPADSLVAALDLLDAHFDSLLAGLSESAAEKAYALDKWSVKELVAHLADCERILAARALWVAREPGIEIPGFDENLFARNSGANDRPFAEILEDRHAVRRATRSLLESIPAKHLDEIGRVDGRMSTPRVLLWMIAGHEQHHLDVLESRYGLKAG